MDAKQLLARFSEHLRHTIARAMALATSLNNSKIAPLHILVTMYEEQGSVGSDILHKSKINPDLIYNLLSSSQMARDGGNEKKSATTVTLPELDSASKKALEKAMLVAYQQKHVHVGTEHLLLGLIESKDQDIKKAFAKSNISVDDIKKQIESVFQNISQFPEIDDMTEVMSELEGMISKTPGQQTNNQPKTKFQHFTALEIFTTNLTDKRSQKNIDPVIGREKEISRLIHILARRTKNNPVLVGEPGVGKTAIVEGLAKQIVNGQVPDILKNKKILALDMALLIAGTIYRGEFEARLKQVIEEVAHSPNTILFIDELHNIVGAGSSQGTMDAANILKPALARGQLHCIGATTIDEYKKHITNDPALERRFQSVMVDEPSKEETIKILGGIKEYYENFHEVQIEYSAIKTAVDLSARYIHDNFLPDKAIDLIDEAAAAVKTRQKASAKQLQLEKLMLEKENSEKLKTDAIINEDFDEALEWKNRIEKIQKQIDRVTSQKHKKQKRALVTNQDIAEVLSNKLNVPIEVLMTDEFKQLENLPLRLQRHIIGQDKVIQQIVKNIQRAKLGLRPAYQPLTSLLFVGPSGVGKTEMAKVLAKEMYHDEKALVRLDMSEFSESHSTSKLLGSPAGYVGHRERNRFIDEIRQRPYCVILLDEIDKAHPDVIKLLLPILDQGELTDSLGKKTHFNNSIIILTTNLGSEFFKSAGIGFDKTGKEKETEQQKTVMHKLKEEFSPAMLNRLSDICIFSPLKSSDLEKIVGLQIQDFAESLKTSQNFNLKANDAAMKQLAKESYHEDYGARQVTRIIQAAMQELIFDIVKQKKKQLDFTLTYSKDKYLLK